MNKKMPVEERKKQIQQSAMKVFLSKGFRNTVMNDIMEETGLSRGGLYHHYNSTYEILYDIMVEGNNYRTDIVINSLKEAKEISQSVLVDIILDKILIDNEYTALYVMFLFELKENIELDRLYQNLKSESIEYIKEVLKKYGYKSYSDEYFEFLINLMNSLILGCEILGVRENFVNNREFLFKMLDFSFYTIIRTLSK